MSRQASDIELLRRAKNGDQKAFSEIFDYYFRAIFVYIYHITRDRMEAEDLAMITMEKAFNNLSTYIPYRDFKYWLFRIARNNAINYLRGNKQECIDIKDFDDRCPESVMITSQELSRIESAIEKLPEGFRKTLIMYYDQDLRYREIAEKLNIKINTVAARMRYARKYLSQLLTK